MDLKYALRGLLKSPGFTAVAVLTLGLGIGANTAIFSVINGALLRPLPFPESDQLVFLWNTRDGGRREPIGPGRMLDFKAEATSFSGFAGISHMPFTLTGSGDPERIAGSSVSSSFFDVLGVRPLLGDPFHTNTADPSAVVLTEGLWRRRFGADPSIVGRTIVLNGRPRLVLAVMPVSLVWPAITSEPTAAGGPELWVPGGPGDVPRSAINEDADVRPYRNTGFLRVVARLKPGVPFGSARAEISAIGNRLSRTHPEDDSRGGTLVPIREQLAGSAERPLLVLAGAVAFVLAIACANVASLLLGRGVARRRDLALRRALGATRARMIRQLLTESIVLAFSGAIAGLLLAWWGSSALLKLAPSDFVGITDIGIDVRVLVFTLAITVLVGVAFGLVPALQLSSDQLTDALAEGGSRSSGSRRGTRTRDVLVGAEIAVAVVLLVGSTLLVRSFVALTRVDTGIDTRNLLTFDITLTGGRAEYQARQVQFYSAMLERLAAVPGVRAAGAAVTLPIGGDDFGTSYFIQGRPMPKPAPRAGYQIVMPGYFRAMGIPLRTGRDFNVTDTRQSAPVAMINETLAREQFTGEDPIGRHVRFDDSGEWMTIVGVVGDIRHLGPATPPRPEVYQSVTQRSFPFIAMVVRTEQDPYASVAAIRRAVAELDPDLPLARVRTMDDHITQSLSRPRFLSTLVAAFGVLAVSLALVGIYGMMAWSVTQRQQEIAIRMALGASRQQMLRMVLVRALVLAIAGIGTGLAVAPLATRSLRGLLYGVTPTDPLAFVAPALALVVVALLSALVPAIRAARVHPAAAARL